MATQYISRRSALKPNSSGGKDNAAPVYVDQDDSIMKFVPGGAGSTTEVQVVDNATNQTIAGTKTFSGTVTTGAQLTIGAGVDTTETYKTSVTREGGLVVTRIVLDMTGLVGSATDLDIIGESAAASCNWGQITTAVNGTLIGGRVTCLEVPAGGTADIDFYSSNVATGTQDVIITDAALGTETALVTSGGAWTSGATKGMTSLPTANDYLYITNGAASGGTFTAGKFEIVLFGS
jgi:hypothetical protein